MKNLAKKATEKAAVLGLSVLSLTANAKEAEKEYNNLDFEIKTELTTLKAQTAIATQTYDATADFKNPAKFSKSRPSATLKVNENLDGDPPEVKKAKFYIALFQGLEGDDLITKMKDEGISLDDLNNNYLQIVKLFNHYQHFRILNDKGDASTSVEKEDVVLNGNLQDKMGVLMEKLHAIITKIKTYQSKKEINDAKANGVVTDYTQIAKNLKLQKAVENLNITFKKDEDGVVKVYVNGDYTNFPLFKPDKTESYEIFPDAENIGVIFVVKLKDGSVLQKKFILKEDTVFSFSRWDNKSEWKQKKKTFKISTNENPAKKEVSMSH